MRLDQCKRCGAYTKRPVVHKVKHVVYNATVQPFCDWLAK